MRRKLKIGIFTAMLSETNGTAEAARRLIIGLGKAGHEVHVHAPSNGVAGRTGVNFHKAAGFRMSREPEFWFALPFFKYFHNRHGHFKELDVCHAITPMTMGALALDVAKLNGIPKIITHHSPLEYYAGDYFPVIGKLFSLYAWKYERLFYNRFHVIHVPTITKKNLIKQHKMKEPIFALTNGILDNYFRRVPGAKEEVREIYNIPLDRKIVLYAGRQGPEKNIEAVLRAFKVILCEKIDAHLVLAGGGPHIPVLRDYAEKIGIDHRITQTGWVKHTLLRKIYDAADVSTLYNDIEAQGLVLLEAMSQGTACVGKNSFGISDVIVDGETGFLVNNEKEFAAQLVKVLKDDELRRYLGENALQNVKKYHKMSNVIKVWEKAYRFLIDEIYPKHYSHVPEAEITRDWQDFARKEPLVKM
ncbi:glycosyltransferase [Candidatus Bathyarchaeota archaeon]|nr:glycosyltransferase [Candidatus Bathyarchaeota archaeon]